MFAWIKSLFAPAQEPNQGFVYIGDRFGKGNVKGLNLTPEPDQNGKLYHFFKLLGEGEHKGKYTPVTVFKLGPSDQKRKLAEERDILESGFELYALDRSEMRFKTFKLTHFPLTYSEWVKRDNSAVKAVKLLFEKSNTIK